METGGSSSNTGEPGGGRAFRACFFKGNDGCSKISLEKVRHWEGENEVKIMTHTHLTSRCQQQGQPYVFSQLPALTFPTGTQYWQRT